MPLAPASWRAQKLLGHLVVWCACLSAGIGQTLPSFNSLLARISFNVPDQQFTIITPKVAIDDIDTHLTEISCGKLGIGGMTVKATKKSEQLVTMAFAIDDLTAECKCHFGYKYIWKGSGTAVADATAANHNNLHSTVSFSSDDYRTKLPNPEASTVDACTASVGFQPMKFSGDNLGGDLVKLFDSTVQSHIEKELGTAGGIACKQLGTLGPELFSSVVATINEYVEPLLPFMLVKPQLCKFLGWFCFDALKDEKALHIPKHELLIDLEKNYIIKVVGLAMAALNEPASPVCHDTWHGRSCSGPLVVNQLALTLTGNTGAVEISDFFSLLGLNATLTSDTSIAETNFAVKGLQVSGLDSFQKFKLLAPIGNYTLWHELAMAQLDVLITVEITMKPVNKPGATVGIHTGTLKETVTLRGGLSNTTLSLATMVAIREGLATAKLGDIVQTPLGCIFSEVFAANLTYANVTVQDIVHPQLHGLLSPALDGLLSGFADTAFLMYEEVLKKVLPGAIQTAVRTDINNLTKTFLSAPAQNICPPRVLPPELTFFDFQKTWLTREVAWAINNAIGYERVNNAIAAVTQAASGVPGEWAVRDLLVNSEIELTDGDQVCLTCARVGKISMRLGNLKVSGLDSLYHMAILQPVGAYTLHNELRMASAEDLHDESWMQDVEEASWSTPEILKASIDVELAIHGTTLHVNDNFTLGLHVTQLHLILDLLLKIDEARIWGIQLQQLTDLKNYLQAIAAVRPTQLALEFGRFDLMLACHSCTSPGLWQLESNLRKHSDLQQLTSALNQFLAKIGEHFTTDPRVEARYREELLQYSEAATSAALNRTNVCEDLHPSCKIWAATLGCTANPVYMNRHCRLSCGLCAVDELPSTPGPPPVVWGIGSMLIVFCSLACLSALCAPCCLKKTISVKYRSRKILCNAGLASLEDQDALSENENGQLRERLVLQSETGATRARRFSSGMNAVRLVTPVKAPSLFRNPVVPVLVRAGVPLALLVNTALFVSGHLTIGAEVDILASFAGEHVRIDRFVEFSLGHSLKDMYNAGAIALFWLVGAFSGAWPYTKLLALLCSWMSPTNVISAETRGSLLLLLDRLGTWSLIDLYVLVMCMLAFHQDITSPTTLAVLPHNFYDFSIVVTPVWGLYAFMFGVILSLTINYVCLVYHRLSVDAQQSDEAAHNAAVASNIPSPADAVNELIAGTAPKDSERMWTEGHAGAKKRLQDHVFEGQGLYYRFKLNKIGQRMMLGTLATAAMLTFIGACVPSFQFRVHGLAGILSDLGKPGSSVMTYSLIGSAAAIAAQAPARYGGHVGILTIACVYLLFALLTPLMLLGNLAYQWVAPLTLEAQKRALARHELISAWSALEVFILAIAVAMLEIGLVSGFIVGKNCDGITAYLGLLVDYALLDKSDATCFVIEASTRLGLFLLLIGSVLTALAGRGIVYLAEEAVYDRQRLLDAGPSGLDAAALAVARPPSLGYKVLHAVLLGFNAVHVWDKSWDADFFSDSAEQRRYAKTAAARTGLRLFETATSQPSGVADLQTIFFGPSPGELRQAKSAASHLSRAPVPTSGTVQGTAVVESALAASSRLARDAVALDTETCDVVGRIEAAQLYEAASAALQQHAKNSPTPAKFLERAVSYSNRAAMLRVGTGAE